ncbi:unnamed protein product [Macrosiphum euphorbiae]|uniref:DUF4806 domain-containing protein n=1 Tax=Macrosiphum euphorbiae TaxID=13131 RepID=A0AAV0Y6R2_9HEMI|nr:unnamed protein product [Macrosiphum euphorbiae]
MLSNAIEPFSNWSLYPVNLVEGLCFDNYDNAVKKEREIFLSASESDRGCKSYKPNFSSRKQLFSNSDNIVDSDSSNDDVPIKVMKKQDKKKSVATSSIIDIPEVSYNFSIESNSNISLGSMSSATKNNDEYSKPCETKTLASTSSNINQNILYDIDQSSNISPAPLEQIPSSGAYMLSAMNTLLNMNEQNVNDYQSGCLNYSENTNTVPISQFSTPRPILSASAILRNDAKKFSVNIDTDQTNILKLIYEQGIETNSYLKRLDGRMDRLEQTIKNMSGTQNNNNYAIDNAFLSIFPLKDIDSLKEFDIRITNDPDFKLNVTTFMTRIGGTDVKNFIKRVLQRIISNELSSKCSWTGFRNNFRLENILFMSIMKDLSREKFNSSDIDFELHIKDWFRHGAQRFIRDQQNKL